MEKKDIRMRLNKYLSDAGVCSRREADALIARGEVFVDGKKAEIGMKILPEQKILVQGNPVIPEKEEIFLAFNKPNGIVCTTTSRFQKNEENIIDFIGYPKRIYPIGRLDKDSEGLILLTNKGEVVNEILRSSNQHEKEYIVMVDKPVTQVFLEQMQAGVPILDTVTRPCKAEKIAEDRFCIVLTQGLNRQIRRMCEYCGYRVVKLKRVRVMNILLGNLPVGSYRKLTEEELTTMKQMLRMRANRNAAERQHGGKKDGRRNSKKGRNIHHRGRSEEKNPKIEKRDRISQ